jgi:RNA polymerase sigma-70 factor (ECF subfamily)
MSVISRSSSQALEREWMPKREQADELALVERHRHGDPSAFDEIFERYQSMVFNLALRMSGSREEASDLSQDTFLRVYRHLGRFKGRSSLKTWIYRIALNCCRSRRARRRPVTQELPEAVALDELQERTSPPERVALARDAGRQIARALKDLPEPFREAVVLRDIEDLSYQEIAAVLHVRIGTVRSRIARGRERLRRIVEGGS